jgi:hypothetical protein
MKDARVTIFRSTLEGLIESLDATVRVTRWTDAESVPQPLKESAAQLLARLGAADRLASATFKGMPADVARVTTMRGAMRRLDAAYVAYRHGLSGTATERDYAETTLRAEIEAVKAHAL